MSPETETKKSTKREALDISKNSGWLGPSSLPLNKSVAHLMAFNEPHNAKSYLKNEEFDSQQTIDVPDSQFTLAMSP